jgi:hypothetical protein
MRQSRPAGASGASRAGRLWAPGVRLPTVRWWGGERHRVGGGRLRGAWPPDSRTRQIGRVLHGLAARGGLTQGCAASDGRGFTLGSAEGALQARGRGAGKRSHAKGDQVGPRGRRKGEGTNRWDLTRRQTKGDQEDAKNGGAWAWVLVDCSGRRDGG